MAAGRVVLDRRVRGWDGDRLLLGGSPWHVGRLAAPAADLVGRLRAAGPAGLVPGPADRAAAAVLVEHGFAHPVPGRADGLTADRMAVVVPAYGRPEQLAACLASVGGRGLDVVVVDDASPDEAAVARVIHAAGARRVRHPVNRGPAAARNTGLAATSAPVVAFLDSDCTADPDRLAALLPHFDDPRVAAVAPRVRPRVPAGSVRVSLLSRHEGARPASDLDGAVPPARSRRGSLLARHEAARSALDMGPAPALVRPGAALGFVPSAALLVRRAALDGDGFDPALRLGEDVDLVWRLAAAGRHVRYEPAATVWHACRVRPGEWLRRRYDYGTSAADLDRRHPGRLAPARPSAWNLAALALLVAGRPAAAAAVGAVATGLLRRRLAPVGGDARLAALVVGQGLLADTLALGHALRREWWPLGWVALGWAALATTPPRNPGQVRASRYVPARECDVRDARVGTSRCANVQFRSSVDDDRKGTFAHPGVPTRGGFGGRLARAAAAAMLAPLALEWLRGRRAAVTVRGASPSGGAGPGGPVPDEPLRVDPVRYVLLRLAEDAAYGSGVLVSAVRGRRPRVLLPAVRLPSRRRP